MKQSSKQPQQAKGEGGEITIEAKSVFVTNGGQVSTEINDSGNAGNISIIAEDDVIFDGAGKNEKNKTFSSIIFTRVRPQAVGNGGKVLIKAGSVSFTNGAEIISNTRGQGNGGDVEIIARDRVLFDGVNELIEVESGIFSDVQRDGQGNGGTITITVTEGSLAITKGAKLISSTQGQGNGGDVIIKVRDQVSIDGVGMNGTLSGIFSNVPTERIDSKSDQKGGSIDIEANSISVTDRARLDTSTSGNDRGGKIRLTTNTLTVQDRGEISTATLSQGNGGEIFVKAQESVLLLNDGVISSSVQEAATGNGGKINIITSSLSLINGGRVEARTLGLMPAVLASESYQDIVQRDQPVAYWRLDETTSIEKAVDSSGNGFNGTYNNGVTQGVPGVSGTAGKFDGNDDANVDVGIIVPGSELDISNKSFTVEAWVKPNEIKQQSYLGIHNEEEGTNNNGNSLYFRVTEKGFVRFGNFEEDLETRSNIINQADTWYHIVASYDQDSNTNTIFVNGREIRSNNQGAFTGQKPRVLIGNWAEADQNSKQPFLNQPFNGVIDEVAVYDQALSPERITSHFLLGQRNLGLSPESFPDSGANAGEITVNANSITISGVSPTNNTISSGLLSDSSGDFSGVAGDITINVTDSLKVEDGGIITVRSKKGVAGNLDITAKSLLLNGGKLLAETQLNRGEEGANITLNVSDWIVMLNESLISAEAFDQAKGGNITIKTDVLIAFPPTGPNGSDIIAKAEDGQGGEITINAEDVRLIEERRAIRGNGTNDIDASSDSGTQGIVTINTGNIDPSRGLDQLPINLTDPSSLIVASCPRSGKISVDELGEFIVTGRGGIPASPFDPIIGKTIIADWVTLDDQTLTEIDHNLDKNQTLAPSTEKNSKPKRIVEAQGWMTGPDGTIILTSFPTDTTSPPKPWYHYLSCRDFN
ncbi:hypothetical protein BJP34_32045 [Moorena producens PAL-8-15-08-1]|uniref:LamG-like jellyroll fold domain-containing protein n=1 Tax=Moorena producens PAL-8-15-08-1 TaxID=1458985 RepID=A0A1D8U0X5_9CYAN|nr:LamG-like jellyroll fold domain-containing protein [Moorena producens]AOX03454.1 hypothetical protein BJP34_32045 [Moorena producens PAL-8-15-08-1]